jgi:hypothetical protein
MPSQPGKSGASGWLAELKAFRRSGNIAQLQQNLQLGQQVQIQILITHKLSSFKVRVGVLPGDAVVKRRADVSPERIRDLRH